MRNIFLKTTSVFVAGLFLFNCLCVNAAWAVRPEAGRPSFLSAWTFTEKCDVQREFLASLYRKNRLIWIAHSEKYQDLLDNYRALALILPSGRYLMRQETADDDLALIRAVTHEDFEILMQREEKLRPAKYRGLMEKILADDRIVELYLGLTSYKDAAERLGNKRKKRNIIFNDLVAQAFELLFLTNEHVIADRELTEIEKEFLDLMRPALIAKDSRGHYKNFSKIFFDVEKRSRFVWKLQDEKEERFYRAADADGTTEVRNSIRSSERVKELLLDWKRRPDPLETGGFSVEDIAEGAKQAFGEEECDSYLNSVTFWELEFLLLFVEQLVEEILKTFPGRYDRILIAGRDAEIFYDALRPLLAGTLYEEKVILFPGSREFIEKLPGEESLQREFLEGFGITQDTFDGQENILFLDTGFKGSVGKLLQKILYNLRKSDRMPNINVRLVGMSKPLLPGNEIFYFGKELMSLNVDMDNIQGMFPRTSSVAEYWFKTLGRDVTSNIVLAAALQLLPHFHGHYGAIERQEDGRLIAVPQDKVESMPDIDHAGSAGVNDNIVNPVAAMLVQRRVVEYFRERREKLIPADMIRAKRPPEITQDEIEAIVGEINEVEGETVFDDEIKHEITQKVLSGKRAKKGEKSVRKPRKEGENIREIFEDNAGVFGGKGSWSRIIEKLAEKIEFFIPPSRYITIQEVWGEFIKANHKLVSKGNRLVRKDTRIKGAVSRQTLDRLEELIQRFTFPEKLNSLINERTTGLKDPIISRSSGKWEDSFIRKLAGIFISPKKKDRRLVPCAVREIFDQAVETIWIAQNSEKRVEGIPNLLDAGEGFGVVIQPFLHFQKSGTIRSNFHNHLVIEAVCGDASSAVRGNYANTASYTFDRENPEDFRYDTAFLEMPYEFVYKGKRYCRSENPEEMLGLWNELYPAAPEADKASSRHCPPLKEEEAREVYRVAAKLEKEIGTPLDIEFGFLDGKLYIIQVRPDTGDFSKKLVKKAEKLKDKKLLASTNVTIGQTGPEGFTGSVILVSGTVTNEEILSFEKKFDQEYIRVQPDAASGAYLRAGRAQKARVLVDPYFGSRNAHNVDLIIEGIYRGEFSYCSGPKLREGLAELDFWPVIGYPGIWRASEQLTYFSDGLNAEFLIDETQRSKKRISCLEEALLAVFRENMGKFFDKKFILSFKEKLLDMDDAAFRSTLLVTFDRSFEKIAVSGVIDCMDESFFLIFADDKLFDDWLEGKAEAPPAGLNAFIPVEEYLLDLKEKFGPEKWETYIDLFIRKLKNTAGLPILPEEWAAPGVKAAGDIVSRILGFEKSLRQGDLARYIEGKKDRVRKKRGRNKKINLAVKRIAERYDKLIKRPGIKKWLKKQEEREGAGLPPEEPEKLRVLFFDDDRALKDLSESRFSPEEYAFFGAETHTEAVDMLDKEDIYCLVFDVTVPLKESETPAICRLFDDKLRDIPRMLAISGMPDYRIKENIHERYDQKILKKIDIFEKTGDSVEELISRIQKYRQRQIEEYEKALSKWRAARENGLKEKPLPPEEIKVLLVVDNLDVADYLLDKFGTATKAGNIKHCVYVKDAIEYLQKKRVDVLFVDCNLPFEKDAQIEEKGIFTILDLAAGKAGSGNRDISLYAFSGYDNLFANIKKRYKNVKTMEIRELYENAARIVREERRKQIEVYEKVLARYQTREQAAAEEKSGSIFIINNSFSEAGELAGVIKEELGDMPIVVIDSIWKLERELVSNNPVLVVTDDIVEGKHNLSKILKKITAKNSETKFVITSSEATIMSKKRYKNKNIVAIVEKPFYFQEILSILKEEILDEKPELKKASLNEEEAEAIRENIQQLAPITREEIVNIIDEINKVEGDVIFDDEIKHEIARKVMGMGLVRGKSALVVGPGSLDYFPILLAKLGLDVSVIDIDGTTLKYLVNLHKRFVLEQEIDVYGTYEKLQSKRFDYVAALGVVDEKDAFWAFMPEDRIIEGQLMPFISSILKYLCPDGGRFFYSVPKGLGSNLEWIDNRIIKKLEQKLGIRLVKQNSINIDNFSMAPFYRKTYQYDPLIGAVYKSQKNEIKSVLHETSEVGIQQAFGALDKKIRGSGLISAVSNLSRACRRTRGVSALHFCVPVEVFKNAPDVTLALNRLSRLGKDVPFTLVVTDVKEEDRGLIQSLGKLDVKKALGLPENIEIMMITEREIQEMARTFKMNEINPQTKAWMIRDLYLQGLGTQELPAGEYMAIATDAVRDKEEAEELRNKLKSELRGNISIRIPVGPDSRESVFSLSKILNNWLGSIRNGEKSTINIILPRALSPREMIQRLEEALREAWRVLSAA